MPAAMMRAIEVRRLGDVEVAHQFLKVTPGCTDEQVEVIAHEDEPQDVDPVDFAGSRETLQEGAARGYQAAPVTLLFHLVYFT
jgi:hypothetical protein